MPWTWRSGAGGCHDPAACPQAPPAPEVSPLTAGRSRTSRPPGGEGEGKAESQQGGRGLLGKGLPVTPISLQGDPGPPGKPVSGAAGWVHLRLPPPQDRALWAAPSTVRSASLPGSQRGCWWRREGNPALAVPPVHQHPLGMAWAGEGHCTAGCHPEGTPMLAPSSGCPQLQWGEGGCFEGV